MNLISLCLAAGLMSVLTLGAVEEVLGLTRASLEKWVETRQLISKTRGDWQADKEMIEQNIQLFERELKAVEESISKLGTGNSQAEKEKVETTVALKASHETLDQAKMFAAGFEIKLAKLILQFPAPLQEILKPYLDKLPAAGVATKLGGPERMQVIIGILNEVDKFNNAISIFSEKRKNQKQEDVAVQSIYVGLGAGYFVNDADDFAGIGSSGANGWEWKTQSELAPAVKEIIRIYRNEQPARFVALPAVIK